VSEISFISTLSKTLESITKESSSFLSVEISKRFFVSSQHLLTPSLSTLSNISYHGPDPK